jgi:septal ring factor EnvC (AmiA/AmiB activator)
MEKQMDLKRINGKIQAMKKLEKELQDQANEFPALSRNTVRILASLKMLELNISDIADI